MDDFQKKQKLLELIGSPRKDTYMFFVKEYLEKDDKWKGWIGVTEVSEYCSSRRKETVGKSFGDPPRRFESFRKDKTCGYWEERREGNCKYVRFHIPSESDILESKDHGFENSVITDKLKDTQNKCEITGLPACDGKLAADHWIPKEKGGESTKKNCVILNKILNEKKNNHLPGTWFCNHLLTNFLKICKEMGNIEEIKEELISFIQGF